MKQKPRMSKAQTHLQKQYYSSKSQSFDITDDAIVLKLIGHVGFNRRKMWSEVQFCIYFGPGVQC